MPRRAWMHCTACKAGDGRTRAVEPVPRHRGVGITGVHSERGIAHTRVGQSFFIARPRRRLQARPRLNRCRRSQPRHYLPPPAPASTAQAAPQPRQSLGGPLVACCYYGLRNNPSPNQRTETYAAQHIVTSWMTSGGKRLLRLGRAPFFTTLYTIAPMFVFPNGSF